MKFNSALVHRASLHTPPRRSLAGIATTATRPTDWRNLTSNANNITNIPTLYSLTPNGFLLAQLRIWLTERVTVFRFRYRRLTLDFCFIADVFYPLLSLSLKLLY